MRVRQRNGLKPDNELGNQYKNIIAHRQKENGGGWGLKVKGVKCRNKKLEIR